MIDKEIRELLSHSSAEQYRFDPDKKNEINRATLDLIMRDVRKCLASKKRVSVVIVKE